MRFNHFSFGGKSVSMILAAACLTLGLAGGAKAAFTPVSVNFNAGDQPTAFTGATTPNDGTWPATWTVTGGTPPVWENVMPSFGNFGHVGITNQTVNTTGV